MLLGKYFGTDSEMDSYLTAISFAFTASALVCAPLSYILVPELSLIQHKKHIGGIATHIVRTFYPYLVVLSFLGFLIQNSSNQLYFNQNAITSAIAWFLLPLNFGILVFASVVQMKGGFLYLGIITVIPSLTAFLFCFFASSRIGIRSALIGQLFGVIIVIFHLVKNHADNCIIIEGINKRIAKNLPRGLISTLVFSVYPISDAYWGKIVGVSTVSHLAYAQKVIVGLSGLIVAGSNIIAFQQIAVFASEGKNSDLKVYLIKKIITILDLILPISIIVGITAETLGLAAINRFDTGRINAQDVISIVKLIQPMLIGMVFMSTMGFIFKALIAERKGDLAAWISLIGSLTYFFMSGIFQYFSGSTGIAYSYMVTWALVFSVSILKYFTCDFLRATTLDSNNEIICFFSRNVLSVMLSWWVLNRFSIILKPDPVLQFWIVVAQVALIVLVFLFVRLICVSQTISAVRRFIDVIIKNER